MQQQSRRPPAKSSHHISAKQQWIVGGILAVTLIGGGLYNRYWPRDDADDRASSRPSRQTHQRFRIHLEAVALQMGGKYLGDNRNGGFYGVQFDMPSQADCATFTSKNVLGTDVDDCFVSTCSVGGAAQDTWVSVDGEWKAVSTGNVPTIPQCR